ALVGLLPAAVREAVARHGLRRAAAWEADVSGTQVLARDGSTVVLRCPLDGSGPPVVEEFLRVDAHPVRDEGDDPVLRAEQAGLHLDLPAAAEVIGPDFRRRLDPWLDLTVAGLSVLVAAELE
ncbi:MAG: hypothetical protein ACRD0S_12720, partial [Acidimicrobiales bacterium]